MKLLLLLITLAATLGSSNMAWARTPDYTGTDHWPTMMALTHLKNEHIIDPAKLDFTKTKTVRLTSEKIGKDLYRQIHQIVFTEKSGKTISVLTVNDVSSEEGSMSDVEVFVISKQLGKYP